MVELAGGLVRSRGRFLGLLSARFDGIREDEEAIVEWLGGTAQRGTQRWKIGCGEVGKNGRVELGGRRTNLSKKLLGELSSKT